MEKRAKRLHNEDSILLNIDEIFKIIDWLNEDINDIKDNNQKKNIEPKKTEAKKPNVTVIKDIRPSERTVYNKKNEKNFKPLFIPEIKDVMFRDPATIVWFEDGSKTVAIAGHGDRYDKEVGLAVCMLKRVLGNKEYRAIMDKWCYTKEVLN